MQRRDELKVGGFVEVELLRVAVWKDAAASGEVMKALAQPLRITYLRSVFASASASYIAQSRTTYWISPLASVGSIVEVSGESRVVKWVTVGANGIRRLLERRLQSLLTTDKWVEDTGEAVMVRGGVSAFKTSASRDKLVELWGAFHGKEEAKLARRLRLAWVAVGFDVLKTVRQMLDAGQVSMAAIQSAIDDTNINKLLVDTAEVELERTARSAANYEIRLWGPSKLFTRWQTKSKKEMPVEVEAAIILLIAELMKQSYWRGMVTTYRDDIAEVIRRGMIHSLTTAQIIAELDGVVGMAASTERAKLAATTEVTAALSIGQVGGRVPLKKLGLITSKEWICIFQNSRDSHEDADGQVVGYNDLFIVGGEAARWPGDPRLSPQNRCNCQCLTTVHLSSGLQVSDEEAMRIFGL